MLVGVVAGMVLAEVLPAPLKLTAQQDHQKMMELLGIKELRRGAEGNNRQAANFQNTDEAKANPWPSLPDALLLKNGEKVSSAQVWWEKRRAEIFEDFDREVYGRVPANVPGVKWEVSKTTKESVGEVAVIGKRAGDSAGICRRDDSAGDAAGVRRIWRRAAGADLAAASGEQGMGICDH